MGGGFALLAATRGFAASAPNYPAGTNAIAPEVLRDACPIVASYGGGDGMTRGAAARLRAALEVTGVEHDVHEYPGARHSYLSHHDRGPQGALVVLGLHFPEWQRPGAQESCDRAGVQLLRMWWERGSPFLLGTGESS